MHVFARSISRDKIQHIFIFSALAWHSSSIQDAGASEMPPALKGVYDVPRLQAITMCRAYRRLRCAALTGD